MVFSELQRQIIPMKNGTKLEAAFPFTIIIIGTCSSIDLAIVDKPYVVDE